MLEKTVLEKGSLKFRILEKATRKHKTFTTTTTVIQKFINKEVVESDTLSLPK